MAVPSVQEPFITRTNTSISASNLLGNLCKKVSSVTAKYFGHGLTISGVTGSVICTGLYLHSQTTELAYLLYGFLAIMGIGVQSVIGPPENEIREQQNSVELLNVASSQVSVMREMSCYQKLRSRSIGRNFAAMIHFVQTRIPVAYHYLVFILLKNNIVLGNALAANSMGMYSVNLLRRSRLSPSAESADIVYRSWYKKYWPQFLYFGLSASYLVYYYTKKPITNTFLISLSYTLAYFLFGKPIGVLTVASIDSLRVKLLKTNSQKQLQTICKLASFAFRQQLILGGISYYLYLSNLIRIESIGIFSRLLLGFESGTRDYETANQKDTLTPPAKPIVVTTQDNLCIKIKQVATDFFKPSMLLTFAIVGISQSYYKIEPTRLYVINIISPVVGFIFSYGLCHFCPTSKTTLALIRMQIDFFNILTILTTSGHTCQLSAICNTSSVEKALSIAVISGSFGLGLGITQHQIDSKAKKIKGGGFQSHPELFTS